MSEDPPLLRNVYLESEQAAKCEQSSEWVRLKDCCTLSMFIHEYNSLEIGISRFGWCSDRCFELWESGSATKL